MPRVYISIVVQRVVLERAQGRCEYCQSWADYATGSFAVEHIVPISRGGSSTLDNLAFACAGCNGHKYNRIAALDPADNMRVPLYNPRQQRWDTHFAAIPALAQRSYTTYAEGLSQSLFRLPEVMCDTPLQREK